MYDPVLSAATLFEAELMSYHKLETTRGSSLFIAPSVCFYSVLIVMLGWC